MHHPPALDSFLPPAPVLVVGDIILDEYLIGRATRLSREAAVPVLEQTARRRLLGGAANPALGLARLGSAVRLAGLVGDDEAAATVRTLLAESGIGAALVTDPQRPTTVKTRIVAAGTLTYLQHLARIDVIDRSPVVGAPAAALRAAVAQQPTPRALLLSHYCNGLLTAETATALVDLARAAGSRVFVDAQADLTHFRGSDLVRCNRHEASAALGMPLPRGPEAAPARHEALARLRALVEARSVVVTLGSDGIAWLDDAGYGEEGAANRSEVFDVTGAGDTVIAVLTAALLAGLPLAEACRLANVGGGIVVRVAGNYAPTRAELFEAAYSRV